MLKVPVAAAMAMALALVPLLPASATTPASSTAVPTNSSSPQQEWLQYRLNGEKNPVISNPKIEDLGDVVYQTKDEVRATPVVVGNRLYVGNHNSGDLFAFNLSTGEELWTNQAPNWVHSEMIYRDGSVYVGYGNRFPQDNEKLRGTGKSGVLALNAETGTIEWQFETDGEVMPTPVYANGSLYAVTGDHHLYEVDPATGKQLSRTDIGSAVSMSSPALADGIIYFGAGHPPPGFTFNAFDTTTNTMKWQVDFPQTLYGMDDVPPAIHDGIVVTTAIEALPSGEDRQEGEFIHVIYGLDAGNGGVLWKGTLGKGKPKPNNKSGAPMIYAGTVFVGSPTTKKFYAYDLKSGDRLWEYNSGTVKGAPVAKDGVVYFGNTDGELHALDARTGEDRGEHTLAGKLAPAGPIIVNDSIIVGSQDSNVYAVPLSDVNGQAAKAMLLWGSIAVVAVLLIGGATLLYTRRWRRDPHKENTSGDVIPEDRNNRGHVDLAEDRNVPRNKA